METLSINTSQNVMIHYTSAGLGNRLLAGILDLFFKMGFILTLGVLVSIFRVKNEHTGESLDILFNTLIFLPYLLYDLLFETFMQGQTFGKKIMKIKVVKLDGTQPSFVSYLLRWFIRLVEIDMCAGLIAIVSIAISKNDQRLGDLAAGTTLIQLRPEVTLKDTILQQVQHDSHKLTFSQISLLNDTDIALAKDVYDFYLKTENEVVLHKFSAKIKSKTGIMSDLPDADFIKTLLEDYSYYHLEKQL